MSRNLIRYPMSRELYEFLEKKRKEKILNSEGYKISQHKFIEELINKGGKKIVKKITKKRKHC